MRVIDACHDQLIHYAKRKIFFNRDNSGSNAKFLTFRRLLSEFPTSKAMLHYKSNGIALNLR